MHKGGGEIHCTQEGKFSEISDVVELKGLGL